MAFKFDLFGQRYRQGVPPQRHQVGLPEYAKIGTASWPGWPSSMTPPNSQQPEQAANGKLMPMQSAGRWQVSPRQRLILFISHRTHTDQLTAAYDNSERRRGRLFRVQPNQIRSNVRPINAVSDHLDFGPRRIRLRKSAMLLFVAPPAVSDGSRKRRRE
jgi:hypothetical protein